MEKNRIYGFGEPVTLRALSRNDDIDKTLDLVEETGFTAVREWMHIPWILGENLKPKSGAVKLYTKTLNRYQKMDVEITGMSHLWYLAGDVVTPCDNSMYPRDLKANSPYMRTLEMLEESWRTLVGLFPQVTQWEVGNEWNTDPFLHPVEWKEGHKGFTAEEKALISIDMMFYAYKGIKAGNPNAVVVSFSPTVDGYLLRKFTSPLRGIKNALELIYTMIKSGRSVSGDTDPDHYFDMLAWHPYLLRQMDPRNFFIPSEVPGKKWKAANDAAYKVMCDNGDGDKRVLFTEIGFNDIGKPRLESKQRTMTENLFNLVTEMPYVKTVHVFRLFMAPGQTGDRERWFGMFDGENYTPRKKAMLMKSIIKGV